MKLVAYSIILFALILFIAKNDKKNRKLNIFLPIVLGVIIALVEIVSNV